MKIAHFVYFAPKRSGLYETTRDLCAAEIALGYDAKLVDTAWVDHKTPSPTSFRLDRGIDIATMEWAEDADIHVLHSRIPDALYGKKPAVVVLHGAPEYVFYSELFGHKQGDGGHTTLLNYGKQPFIKKFVTFWPRHLDYWKALFGDARVVFVNAPVKMDEYTPEGPKHVFQNNGKINIGFCDTWRPTFFKDPFQILVGVRRYWLANPDVRLQIFGIPSDEKRIKEWGGVWDRHILAMKRQGDFFGDIHQMHDKMADVYRSLDVVITSSVDASRIVRESLSCGTPVIAPYGNQYSGYTCDLTYPEGIAEALQEVLMDLSANRETVRDNCLMVAKQFNSSVSAREFVTVLEQTLEETPCVVS